MKVEKLNGCSSLVLTSGKNSSPNAATVFTNPSIELAGAVYLLSITGDCLYLVSTETDSLYEIVGLYKV
jgi:hypothetical protein